MKMTTNFEKDSAMKILAENRYEVCQVETESVIRFPEGILGFEDAREFVLKLNEDIKPFLLLQSVEEPELSFVCIESFGVAEDFSITLPRDCVDFLGIEKPEDALVLSLVTVSPDPRDITCNLMSPVVINLKDMIGKQVVVTRSKYPIRYNIWTEVVEPLERSARAS